MAYPRLLTRILTLRHFWAEESLAPRHPTPFPGRWRSQCPRVAPSPNMRTKAKRFPALPGDASWGVMQQAMDESVTDLQERIRVHGFRHVDVLGVRAEGAAGVGHRALLRALRRRVAELWAEAGLGSSRGETDRSFRTSAKQRLNSADGLTL